MRRKLDTNEKLRIQTERHRVEQASFPDFEIEVIVEDYTYANGDPIIRVVNRGPKDTPV